MVEKYCTLDNYAGTLDDDIDVFHGSAYLNSINAIFAVATLANINGIYIPVIILDDRFELDDGPLVVFGLYHELGHIILGHLDPFNNTKKECWVTDDIYYDPEYEHQADLFAINKLIDSYGYECIKNNFLEIRSKFNAIMQTEEDDGGFIFIDNVINRAIIAINELAP